MSERYAWEKPFFKNREEAAGLLAGRLVDYKGQNPLVLAIPRGAVPMGRIIADDLGGELDLVLVHKVASPDNPELALGAVGESGEFYEAPFARSLGFSEESLQKQIHLQTEALRQKRKIYLPGRPSLKTEGRIVILVDDGIATASTVMAAIRDVRHGGPLKVVVASPVAPPEAVNVIRQEADEVVVLTVQTDFAVVSEFFEDFRQVSDEEVKRSLKNSAPSSRK